MEIDRLKSSIWIQAQIRICALSHLSTYVIKKGDPDAGAIFILINKLNGDNFIYYQKRDMKGDIGWEKSNSTPLNEKEVSDYLEKQKKYDPDLWILEIEDPAGEYKFGGTLSQ